MQARPTGMGADAAGQARPDRAWEITGRAESSEGLTAPHTEGGEGRRFSRGQACGCSRGRRALQG